MEKIRIEVDKVILYYMDRVDPDGNPYRFYVYNREPAALYDRLWREADEYAMNNFRGEELDYYYKITD